MKRFDILKLKLKNNHLKRPKNQLTHYFLAVTTPKARRSLLYTLPLPITPYFGISKNKLILCLASFTGQPSANKKKLLSILTTNEGT